METKDRHRQGLVLVRLKLDTRVGFARDWLQRCLGDEEELEGPQERARKEETHAILIRNFPQPCLKRNFDRCISWRKQIALARHLKCSDDAWLKCFEGASVVSKCTVTFAAVWLIFSYSRSDASSTRWWRSPLTPRSGRAIADRNRVSRSLRLGDYSFIKICSMVY